jgi:hypothetical protein
MNRELAAIDELTPKRSDSGALSIVLVAGGAEKPAGGNQARRDP